MKVPAEDRFAARLKLAKLPRNSSTVNNSAAIQGVFTIASLCELPFWQ